VGRFVVVNAYTQQNTGGGVQVSYVSIRECFRKVKQRFSSKRIAFPLIGCGLGGGDWSIVSKIIDEELDGEIVSLRQILLTDGPRVR